jgi:hypothetical protein
MDSYNFSNIGCWSKVNLLTSSKNPFQDLTTFSDFPFANIVLFEVEANGKNSRVGEIQDNSSS